MKLIKQNSPLKCLPQNISLKEIIIFDAIRFTCEMIDSTYPKFLDKILDVINSKPNSNFPSIFQDCWLIIDCSARVEKICRKLPWEKPDEILSDFTNLRLFRNTFQHLEDRIDKTISITKMPLYGIITWIHKLPNSDKVELYQLISGNVLSDIGTFGKQTIETYDEKSSEINNLNLQTFDANGNNIILDIEDLILKLKKLITELENRFVENKDECNFIFPDWSKRQDITLRIKSEK